LRRERTTPGRTPAGQTRIPARQEETDGEDARGRFEILGDDMQFVKITLDPGEAAVAEAGG